MIAAEATQRLFEASRSVPPGAPAAVRTRMLPAGVGTSSRSVAVKSMPSCGAGAGQQHIALDARNAGRDDLERADPRRRAAAVEGQVAHDQVRRAGRIGAQRRSDDAQGARADPPRLGGGQRVARTLGRAAQGRGLGGNAGGRRAARHFERDQLGRGVADGAGRLEVHIGRADR